MRQILTWPGGAGESGLQSLTEDEDEPNGGEDDQALSLVAVEDDLPTGWQWPLRPLYPTGTQTYAPTGG